MIQIPLLVLWRVMSAEDLGFESPLCVGTNIQSSREAKRVGCVWTLSWGSVHMELSMGQLVAYRCMQFIHGHVFIIGGIVSLLKRKHT